MLTITRNYSAVATFHASELIKIKKEYINKLGLTISAVRLNYITDLIGQEMIYLRKEQEAVAFMASLSPNLVDYPMIAAEIGITALTGYEVAQVWLYMSDMWLTIAAMLETIRLTAVNSINAAISDAEIFTAYTVFKASLVAFEN